MQIPDSTKWVLLPMILLIAASWIPVATLSPEQRAEAADVHNRLRRSVHPPAADMILLTWNPRLEQLAQQAANSCVTAHNYNGPYTGLGENIYKGPRKNITEIVSLFFAEQAAFDFAGGGVCNTGRSQNTIAADTCSHYLQVVASNMAEVGCAMANCSLTDSMFVCEYDAQYAAPLPYMQGQPCGKCPDSRAYCARGLCANYTTAVNATGNATCSLQCLNCGNLVNLGSTACQCSCPTGYAQPYCTKSSAGATPPQGCTVCRALATPCRNGSNETSTGGSACKCACPPDYRGPQCDIPKDAYDQALLVGLRGPQICSNGKCGPQPPPVDPMQFRQRVWPTLSDALARVVNMFCGANATNFAACCPNVTFNGGGGGGGRALVQPTDLDYIEASLSVGVNQDLLVAVFGAAQAGNSMCAAAPPPGRRKRAAASTSPVPYLVLNSAMQTYQSAASENMTGCCDVQVSTLQQYSAVADSAGDVTTVAPVIVKNSAIWRSGSMLHALLAAVVAVVCNEFFCVHNLR